MITKNLSTLKINTLSQKQYDNALDNGEINNNELYLTPDIFSADDKIKLDNIEENAQVNIQSDWDVEDESDDAFIHNKPIFLIDGKQTTTSTSNDGSNIYTFTKSDGTTSTLTVRNGSKGSKGDQGEKGDTGPVGPQGPQGEPGKNATTTKVATQSSNGLMSASDKKKLDGIRFEFVDGTLYIYDEN